MTRYAVRRLAPRGCECDDDPPFTQDITVYEDEDWIDTGLLDARGEPVLRSEKGPLGFDLSPR